MKNIYEKITELYNSGKQFAIATVIETSGSTPRKSGSKMIIESETVTSGTVGGGILEY
ncbi:MAG: XdhC family protein, partial [Actinomycetia bacterium]|nr:XdhC family protein [Actinomycetes bacterium]